VATDRLSLTDPLPIEPLRRAFDVAITPPGSKSLTCRAYLLAALADGASTVRRPLRSDDTDGLLRALVELGVSAVRDGEDVRVQGLGGRLVGGATIDLGDGCTPARFMLAAACLADAPVVVDGSPRMRERPVAELLDLLRRLGATIECLGAPEHLPVRVDGRGACGGALDVPTTASSQFISALLLIGSSLPGGLALRHLGPITSEPYVRLTEHIMGEWGITVDVEEGGDGSPRSHRVPAGTVAPRCYEVEPDASSAVYWWTAALLIPGARARVPGLAVRSPQPDARFPGLLGPTGAGGAALVERDGTVVVEGGARRRPPSGGHVSAAGAPDGALALAVYAAMVNEPAEDGRLVSRIEGLRTLKVKETDRIGALAAELRRIGCTVSCTDDAIEIDPATRHDRPAEIRTYRDHRMAMAFAVLGLARPGIRIVDPGCVSKSYPGFWSDLGTLYASASSASP
jgi:3-phosphoshikimate 1-carboxyvinyltransferase